MPGNVAAVDWLFDYPLSRSRPSRHGQITPLCRKAFDRVPFPEVLVAGAPCTWPYRSRLRGGEGCQRHVCRGITPRGLLDEAKSPNRGAPGLAKPPRSSPRVLRSPSARELRATPS